MLTEPVARSLGFNGNFNSYKISNTTFTRSELLWRKTKNTALSPPALGNKAHQHCFYKLGKTLGFETNRYIQYKDGALYYYENDNDQQYKGYCMTENLYMYYFHIGYRDILYLTNGLDSSTFYFPNNAFMNSVSHNFLKDVVQVDFREKYKMIEEIGEGTFSKVYLVYHRFTNKKYAAKVVPKIDSHGFNTKAIVQEEKKILKYLNSNLICQMHEFFQDNDCYTFILEYISGKDLSKVMKQQKEMSLNDNIFILKQVLRALEYIHAHHIIHRDLKPHNIVIKLDDKSVKLVDFGLSLLYDNNTELKRFMRCGTMGYIAPEIVNNSEMNRKKYDTKSDMFGFGIIAHMLLMGTNPIRGKHYDDTVNKNIKCNFTLDKKQILLRYGAACYDLLSALLQKDPTKRITASQALKSPFFEVKHKDQQTVINSQIHGGEQLMNQHKHDEPNYIEDQEYMLTQSKFAKLITSINLNNSIDDANSPTKKTAASWMSHSKFS